MLSRGADRAEHRAVVAAEPTEQNSESYAVHQAGSRQVGTSNPLCVARGLLHANVSRRPMLHDCHGSRQVTVSMVC